jgi:hypothetical protein
MILLAEVDAECLMTQHDTTCTSSTPSLALAPLVELHSKLKIEACCGHHCCMLINRSSSPLAQYLLIQVLPNNCNSNRDPDHDFLQEGKPKQR